MRRYWDASALVDALHEDEVERKALEPDQWTHSHALAEAFATLTGGRLGFRYSPDDAAALVKEITAGMSFADLAPAETIEALEGAQKRGVRGGRP